MIEEPDLRKQKQQEKKLRIGLIRHSRPEASAVARPEDLLSSGMPDSGEGGLDRENHDCLNE